MKSISHGTVSERMRSAMKNTAPLSTPTSSSSRAAEAAETSRPSSRIRSCSRSSSIRISPTPASTSVCDTSRRHPLCLHDPGHRDDLVTAHDERPAFPVGARDLCIDEDILDLLRAAGEAVAGTPPAYLKPWNARLDPPRPPFDGPIEVARAGLEPEPVVLTHRWEPAAEVDALRAGARVEQLDERRRHRPPLVERAENVLARRRMDAFEERQHLVADETAQCSRVRRVGAPFEAALGAERLCLLAPHAEKRAHD